MVVLAGLNPFLETLCFALLMLIIRNTRLISIATCVINTRTRFNGVNSDFGSHLPQEIVDVF